MKALKTIGAAALASGLILGLSGPAAGGDTQQALSSESVLETIKKRGELRVGLSTFVPWAMRDKNGELIGFEIDVARKVAEDMGVGVDFVPTAWDGIIPALLAASSTRSSAACRSPRSGISPSTSPGPTPTPATS